MPVGLAIAEDSVEALRREADKVVVLATPASLDALGRGYLHFEQSSGEEVQDLLARSQPVAR